MTTKKGKTSLRNNKRGHIIAIHRDNRITYHYVESQRDEDQLIGEIVGKYTAAEFLKDEKRIQLFHKMQLEKEHNA